MNLDFYYKQGYWIEEGVLTEKECDVLIAEGRKLENYKTSMRPQMMPHRDNNIFLGALRCPALVNAIDQAVSGIAVGLQTEYFYCKPGTKGFSLHQDNFFVQARAGVFASAWVALTDTYKQKGGLIVYPGTHKLGLLPVRDLKGDEQASQDPNANKTECVVPAGYKPVHISVPKGAAVIIDGHLVHGSNENYTEEWRYVLLSTYIRKGEKFRAGKYAQREAVDL